MEERCQQLRNAAPGAVEAVIRAHERRALRVCAPAPGGGDTGRGTLTLSVELAIEAGELVCQALDKAVEAEDQQGQWYFMRPDGRAIPRYGYQPDDMVDEGLGDGSSTDSGGDSAEAPEGWRVTPHSTALDYGQRIGRHENRTRRLTENRNRQVRED